MKTMVRLLTLSIIFCTFSAQAQYLECDNIYAPPHFDPIFTAKIEDDNSLSHMKWDFRSVIFSAYRIDKTENLENWGNEPRVQKGVLKQPRGTSTPTEITATNRPTYRGNNSYSVTFGHYSDQWPSETYPELAHLNRDYDYDGEFILPLDLTPESLELARFRGRETERANAVMIYASSPAALQNGMHYLRMFCSNVEELEE